jgi:DNA adenine methylase
MLPASVRQASNYTRPFLKWAGNKYRLLPRILAILPAGQRLIEPFAGAAALSLNVHHPQRLINDSNRDLITLFQLLQQHGEEFIAECRRLFTPENNTVEAYNALRNQFNQCIDPHQRAALFCYLNRHGYNGLCRYSKNGYNVPFGRYKEPRFPGNEMRHFHRISQKATFTSGDFSTIMQQATPGDVIYCDPPYAPLSTTAMFTNYDGAGSFTLNDQERLAAEARACAQRGIPVVISNHDTPFIRQIYRGATIKSFEVTRTISCDIKNRTPASELLACFGTA